jgi:glycosyltransferase involved in cell wall biosynthesis
MRLLFVADGRSPIAMNWIRYFIKRGDEVHLASTFACQPEPGLASVNFIPVAFSAVRGGQLERATPTGGADTPRPGRGLLSVASVGLRTSLRHWFGALTIPAAGRRLVELSKRIKPDLVHAMRIPYEGMLAAKADQPIPLVVSVWGNDFTLHARANPWMAKYTRTALQRAAALHTDCRRDRRLAGEWGFPSNRPSIIVPGNGGIRLDVFYPPSGREAPPVILNPRGFRAYVRNDTFFRSIPLLLAKLPLARFICVGMAGEPQAQRWRDRFGIAAAVELLPPQSQEQMAELFRRAQVAVSPSTHDGTPNTLLEAMACGCFPIAGDIESLREWITPGENGLLIDPGDAQDLAQVVLEAFARPDLRANAAQTNQGLIAERAEYQHGMRQALDFYLDLLAK